MTADLAMAADPGFLERSADPAEFVIQACERAKVWLREALEHGDIDQIVEVKAQADAIRVYTMQKQLGKDAQLSAAEIVRRAERGIGVAIRRGQQSGEIRKKGDDTRTDLTDRSADKPLVSPLEFFNGNTNEKSDAYAMRDAPDEDFEDVIKEARAEGNLSRANVVRKIQSRPRSRTAPSEWMPEPDDHTVAASTRRRELIRDYAGRGYSSRQMEEMTGTSATTIRQIARDMSIEIPADAIIGKTRHHDSNRIVRETVHALEGLAMGVQLVEPDDLDQDEIQAWAVSLTESIRVLNRLIKTMRKAAQ